MVASAYSLIKKISKPALSENRPFTQTKVINQRSFKRGCVRKRKLGGKIFPSVCGTCYRHRTSCIWFSNELESRKNFQVHKFRSAWKKINNSSSRLEGRRRRRLLYKLYALLYTWVEAVPPRNRRTEGKKYIRVAAGLLWYGGKCSNFVKRIFREEK